MVNLNTVDQLTIEELKAILQERIQTETPSATIPPSAQSLDQKLMSLPSASQEAIRNARSINVIELSHKSLLIDLAIDSLLSNNRYLY